MHSAFHTASNSIHFPLSWRTNSKPVSSNPNLCLRRPLNLTNSLRTSIGYESQSCLDDGPEPGPGLGPSTSSGLLPVVIRRSGRVSRYFWDGNCLQLVGFDGGSIASSSSISFDFDDGFRTMSRLFNSALRDFLIPKKVSAHYMDYVKWKFLHRVFSSALQVIATQAMFRAIGIGYSRSLASAAALNWVLKDGLGRLCRCIYTASLASAFDTNLKRVRFSTSVIFSMSIGIELLTPVYPQYFLLLATIANIAKQISLACYLATSSAVHRSFAIADNIGEVSAKAQIQSVCFDNLGLMLAAILNLLFNNNQRLQAGLPFLLYPIFATLDLVGIYQGLKHVHLQTLTKDRLEIIVNTWIELGYVPSPAEVSKAEGIVFLCRKGKALWPVRVGSLNPKSQIPELSMMAMRSVTKDDYYFISMEINQDGLARTDSHGILLCLREGATTSDVTVGILQACYIRKAILLKRNVWEQVLNARYVSDDIIMRDWLKLMEDSKQSAKEDALLLSEQMPRLGWAVKNVLLSTQEQARYSFVHD